jgi:transcriptional regulator with XRE-family HTH domain
MLRHRLANELERARKTAGLSLREVGRRLGVRHELVARVERGDPSMMRIDLLAEVAEVVGLQLAASLHPNGDPVRDTAHLQLLARFRRRMNPRLRWRVEVPIPIAGDPRSADALIEGGFGTALVEAETHLGDIQAIERKTAAKARDLGVERLILLVSDTRHNRSVTRLHPELRERFPVDTRTCLGSLGRGSDPGGDCLVVL